MNPTRIVWTRREGLGRSGWTGTVRMRHLFTIESSVTRGEGWKLHTRLPLSIKADKAVNHDDDVLKATAERILAAFVRSIGAGFPEEN